MKESVEDLINKAAFYQINNKPNKALKYFQKILQKTRKYPKIYSKIFHQKMMICDWSDLERYKRLVDKYYRYDSPFTNILRVDNPKKNFIIAKYARISPRI